MIFDAVVLGLVCLSVILGAWKGLAWQLAGLVSLLAGFLVALPASGPLAEALGWPGPFGRIAAIAALYFFTSLAIYLAAFQYRRAIQRWQLDPWDRHLGALFGAAKGIALALTLTFFATALFGRFREPILETWTGGLMCRSIEAVAPALPAEVHAVLRPRRACPEASAERAPAEQSLRTW